MNALQARIKDTSTIQLKELAVEANKDFRDECTLVLNEIMAELMVRLSETDFCNFCDILEGEA